MKKKCSGCNELKPFTDFYKCPRSLVFPPKDGLRSICIICWGKAGKKNNVKRLNTEIGYLKMRYGSIRTRGKKYKDMKYQCYFTFKEFYNAFKKHKETHGMNSAWGPHHLPMTMIYQGRSTKKIPKYISNLSCDRLDSSKPYTLQNLIFIRTDENDRKKDTSYEDCITQIKLHKKRFIEMGSL